MRSTATHAAALRGQARRSPPGLVDYAIGTETNGSISCPASANGIVGFKPSVGLVSRTHIVPISVTQDTAGPMTRTVRQAAEMLTAIAGSDPADPATAEADKRKADYVAALDAGSLKGKRLGLMRFAVGLRHRCRARPRADRPSRLWRRDRRDQGAGRGEGAAQAARSAADRVQGGPQRLSGDDAAQREDPNAGRCHRLQQGEPARAGAVRPGPVRESRSDQGSR